MIRAAARRAIALRVGAEAKWTLSWPQQRATTRADRAAKSAAASAAVTERALTDRRTGQALPAV